MLVLGGCSRIRREKMKNILAGSLDVESNGSTGFVLRIGMAIIPIGSTNVLIYD